MAKNYFDRYIWLIDTIKLHGHIQFSEISDMWEDCALNDRRGEPLSNRTFFNHLEAIYSTFGIEIKCNRSRGYYIANSDDLESDGIRHWVLESLSMNNVLNESRDMRDRILFEKTPSSQHWLTILIKAIKDKRAIEMTYQSYNRPEPNTFEVHPWCLKLFKQRWYLLGKSEAYNEPRVYAFDRIQNIKMTGHALKVPKKFNANEFFSLFFGIIVDDRQHENIQLKVDADQVKYYKSLPLHDTQREIEATDEYSIFEYRLVPTFDFKQEVLSKGPSVEVLAPESFRDEVKADIKAMFERYD